MDKRCPRGSTPPEPQPTKRQGGEDDGGELGKAVEQLRRLRYLLDASDEHKAAR